MSNIQRTENNVDLTTGGNRGPKRKKQPKPQAASLAKTEQPAPLASTELKVTAASPEATAASGPNAGAITTAARTQAARTVGTAAQQYQADYSQALGEGMRDVADAIEGLHQEGAEKVDAWFLSLSQ